MLKPSTDNGQSAGRAAENARTRRQLDAEADRAFRDRLARERSHGQVFRTEAERLEQLARWHPRRRIRDKAIADLRALEAREVDREHATNVAQGLDETVALGEGRGEVITVAKDGRVRAQTRDILGFMYAREFISKRQWLTGLQYQRTYEQADPARALTPPAPDGVKGVVSGGGSGEQFAERLTRAVRLLAAAHGYLRGQKGGQRMVEVVRWVAGENRPISGMATGGRARERAGQLLKRGLDHLADLWRILPRELGPASGSHAQAVTSEVSASPSVC